MADELEQPKPNGKDTRFKPGAEWRGNKGGRPKSKPISDAYRLYFSNYQKFCRTTPAKLKAAIEGICKAAVGGDSKAMAEITNRIEGKVPSVNVEVGGNVDGWTKEELQSYAAGGPLPERFKHVLVGDDGDFTNQQQ